MAATYWYKQTADQPLFPNMLWSRPENRTLAGKLLVVGGNAHGFTAPADAYAAALKAKVGTCRVLLPDSLYKTVGKLFPEAEFAPSTPGASGSFARLALAEVTAAAEWADGVLLAGDFGKNSETAILLESFLTHYDRSLTLANDAVDYCLDASAGCLTRPHTALVLTTAQLRKLAVSAKYPAAFTSDIDLVRLVDLLHDFTAIYPCSIIVEHLENIVAAHAGQVSTTKLSRGPMGQNSRAGAFVAVWWLQNSGQPFKALACAAYDMVAF